MPRVSNNSFNEQPSTQDPNRTSLKKWPHSIDSSKPTSDGKPSTLDTVPLKTDTSQRHQTAHEQKTTQVQGDTHNMPPSINASKKPKRKRRKNAPQSDSDPLSPKELLKHIEENLSECYQNKHYPLNFDDLSQLIDILHSNSNPGEIVKKLSIPKNIHLKPCFHFYTVAKIQKMFRQAVACDLKQHALGIK